MKEYREKKKDSIQLNQEYIIKEESVELPICDRTCEKGPCRASFQNRVITTIGKSRL